MKNKLFFLSSLFIFTILLTKIDHRCAKASHRFCLHFIDGPPTANPAWETKAPYPLSVLDQPFFYLGKGAQSFVFESADRQSVIKFYKFPAHLRRFDWIKHPFGDTFSPKNRAINLHNEKRFNRSFNSFLLAYNHLQKETGVFYIHLNPTPHLPRTLQVYDRSGTVHQIPLERLGFVLQKKGKPFLPMFRSLLEQGHTKEAQQMIDSLFQLIISRCRKGISDLDNMDHDNYGWYEGRALHLDIGRFVLKDDVKIPAHYLQEIERITSPLRQFLEKQSPELLEYYDNALGVN